MYAYNPRKKSPRQLEDSLVGDDRWDILHSIMREMVLDAGDSPKQHWMIIGPRGIGKSHLMTLLYYKVKDNQKLMKSWLPILFPEDLRMAATLSRFLERTVNEILQEFIQIKNPIADELKERLDKINKLHQEERTDSYFAIISWCYEKTGRHFLLLIENLQQLLGKKIRLIEQKKLRAFLQTSDSLLIIGSATTIFDAIHDHSNPFYHFFHTRRLKDLDFSEMKRLMINILSETGQPELTKNVNESEARLKTLYSFTGGNPRMAVFLSDILRTEVPDEMLDFMDNVLDQLTPYFESILNDTPYYMEEIINTLAVYEPAQSPKEIAEHLETPQPTIRNYLKQLKETGYIRIAFSKGKSNYYCLNEYLYRIWYQMRDSSHREETRWLMEMLLMLYSPVEIIEHRKQLVSYGDLEDKTFPYKRYFIQAAEFIESNPSYCKVIEMCAESMIAKESKIIESKEKKLLEEANDYFHKNQFKETIKICKEILRLNPNSEDAYLLWGISLSNQGKYEEAIGKSQEAIKIAPKSYLLYRVMGNCYRDLGQYNEAEEQYKKAIEINNKYEYAYISWGILLEKQKLYDEAIEKYKKIIEINHESEGSYWHWGSCLRAQKHFEDAIEKFQEAIKIDPKSYPSYGAMGDCYRELGQYDEAEMQYKKAIELNDKYEDAYRAWGVLLEKQELYDEAINKFISAIDINPQSDRAYRRWGNCLEQQGFIDEAIKKYEKSAQINPNSEVSYIFWGSCLERLGNFEEANEKFQKAIDINPSSEQGYISLSECFIEQGRIEEAIEIFEQRLTHSKDCRAVHSYGNALMEAKRYDEALTQFKKLIEEKDKCYQVHLSYGELLEKMNEKELAIIAYIRHLSLGSGVSLEELDFQGIYDEKLKPLLSTFNPGDYVEQFYVPEKERKFSEAKLSILLILLSRYDTVSEHIKDIIKTHLNEEGEKRQDFDLLIFTIKLSIWLKLCAGNIHEALRLADFYMEYIRALENDRQKEKEVFSFSVSLFRIQLNSNIKPDDILKVLEHFQKSEGVPFRDVILKIWTCLSDPDSVDAQRYMSEKAIGEIVKELKKKKSSEALVCDMLTG